jgi:hypothetical protein
MANNTALRMLAALRRKVGPKAPILDPYGLLNEVSMDILSRIDYHPLWKTAILRTVAPYTTGTVAITVAGTTVTGTDTVWTDAMAGRKFKCTDDTAYYRIDSVTDGTHLELETAYAESANAVAETYEIYQDEYSLASDFDGFKTRMHDLRNNKLLDHRAVEAGENVYIISTGTGSPDMVVPIGVDSDGNFMVRLQPSPNTVEIYECRYRKKRTLLNEWDDAIDFPPEDEEMFLAGLVARVVPTKGNVARFENYFKRFAADVPKDDTIRYIRGGMRGDSIGSEWPRHESGYLTAP